MLRTSPTSHNPEIMWDKGLFEGEQASDVPSQFHDSADASASFLDIAYDYLINKKFDIKGDVIKDFRYHYGGISAESSIHIEELSKAIGFQLQEFTRYTFVECINTIIKYSPYFIRTTNMGSINHDNEPGKQMISGYDGLSLLLLIELFTSIEMYSASFSNYHPELLNWFNIDFIEEDFNPNNKENKHDFGCFLLHNKSMTPEKLHLIKEGLGRNLHFASNINDFNYLTQSLSTNKTTRYDFMAINKLFSTDISTESKLTEKVYEIKPKKILLSYWGSSLSTGVNLGDINVCSINLKISVPFIFLPKSAAIDSQSLIFHINTYLTSKIDQMAGRICREKGDNFKFIIINKTESKGHQMNRQQFLQFFFESDAFKEKFSNFGRMHDFEVNELSVALLKSYKKLNIPLDLPEPKETVHIENVWIEQDISNSIKDELIRLGLQLDKAELITYTKKLPSDYKDLKTIFKDKHEMFNVAQGNWFEQLMLKDVYIIHTTLSKDNFVIEFRLIYETEINTIQIYSEDSIEIIDTKIKPLLEVLNEKSVFIGFLNDNYDGPLINLLMETKTSIFDHNKILSLLSKDRPSIKKITKQVAYWIDLRTMCKQKNRLSLYDVGTQLHLRNLPHFRRNPNDITDEELEYVIINNRRCLGAIEALFRSLFRADEIDIFNELLKVLRDEYGYNPKFNEILGSFTSSPQQRMESLYLVALGVKSTKYPKFNKRVIDNHKQLKLIEDLHWYDSYIKQSLKHHYGKTIIFDPKKTLDFLFEKGGDIELTLNIDCLKLSIKRGGVRSENINIKLHKSSNKTIREIDIVGFYSWLIKKFKLIEDSELQNFFNQMLSRRESAIKSGDHQLQKALKRLLNIISGKIGSSVSVYFHPQKKIELIQLGQIILCNLVDLLLHNNCEIFGVHTDGLVVATEPDKSFEFLEKWSNLTEFKLTNEELTSFILNTSGNTVKHYKDGSLKVSGLNISKNITPDATFNYNKPLIIQQLLKGDDSLLTCNTVSVEKLHDLIYLAKSQKPLGLEICHPTGSIKCSQLRYIRAKSSDYVLKQSNRQTMSIIPLNSLQEIPSNRIDWEHYKSLILDLGEKPVQSESALVVNIEQKQTLDQLMLFYNEHGHNFAFIPKTRNGNLPGEIASNIIKDAKIPPNAIALAIIIDPDKCFVIDVDDSIKLPSNIKDYIKQHAEDMCISYHNTVDLGVEDVVSKHRFKLFFKCDDNIKHVLFPLQRLYDNISTEICFNKNFTVAGYHRSLTGSTYKFIGGKSLNNIEPPSDELIKLLIQTSKSLPLEYVTRHVSGVFRNISKEQAENIINIYLAKNKDATVQRNALSLKVRSVCPFADLHTTQSKVTDFDITYKIETRTLYIGCFHSSCRDKVINFAKSFVNTNANYNKYDQLMPIDL